MQTWEDCLASLRAGAAPEEVLPKVRSLFANLPAVPAPAEETEPVPPTARLYHTFPEAGDHVFQLPYLRAPFHVWEAVDSGERPDERQTMFDSELVVDVLAAFQPRFVDPPERRVREMLRRFTVSGVSGVSDDEADEMEVETGAGAPAVVGGEVRCAWSVEDVKRFSGTMFRFFDQERKRRDMDDEEEYLSFPSLNVAEWSMVFSGLEEDCDITVRGLKRLLLGVNQSSLSLVVLQSVFPLLIADDSGSEETLVFTDLVTTAVSRAELHKLPVAHIRSLLDLYRGMDAGVLGALAQLKVVTHIGNGRQQY